MALPAVPALSPRLQALREDVVRRHGSFLPASNPFLLDVALWRAAAVPGRSRVQVRAAFLHELAALAPIDILPDWSLAGEHLIAGPWPAFGFLGSESPAALHRLLELGLSEREEAEVRRCVRAWFGTPEHCVDGQGAQFTAIGEVAPQCRPGRGGWGLQSQEQVFWGSGWIENHSVRDFAKVLRLGFAGIRREVEERLAAASVAHPDFPQCESFWRAALSVCDAGIRLGQRYAALARERAAAAGDPAERARLQRIADVCDRVPAEGARTFLEATQALWSAHVLTCGEDGINANSIGRLDQILWPYYEADRRAGRLTRDEAVELMAELACKLHLDYNVQAIVLGGRTRDGRDAVNELSHVILEATAAVDLIRDLSVRLHRDSPDSFVERSAELIARGGGIPFLFNDDCFIPALETHGIAPGDARDYAPIGCIELTVPGRANPHAVSGWFNSTKCLELALFDGCDPRTGTQLGPHTGMLTAHCDFAALWAAYRCQVEHFARAMVYHCNRGELAQRERGPLPCWSVLTDDCIARGRDITDGGALYNYHSVCFLGTANTADSLMALRRLLFEAKAVTAAELLAALRNDFAGAEPLRQQLLTRVPKYGNDCAEVDVLAARVASEFIDLMDGMRSPLGGRYVVHLFSFLCNVAFGKSVGATPDGRRAGEPLAYSLSAQQGRDQEGVSAMLSSLARLPHARAAGATAAIVELDPRLVAGPDGVRRLAQTIRAAMALGVGQLQFNVTTAERLRQAQGDPERYGNIAVRVAGFSQLFRLVDRELQDHIIARTKHVRG